MIGGSQNDLQFVFPGPDRLIHDLPDKDRVVYQISFGETPGFLEQPM
jgi:hypothetical protein